jgi:hypothetical protein
VIRGVVHRLLETGDGAFALPPKMELADRMRA